MQIDIPGYRIIRTLGKGGMASVYLAIQESFEREVALKIMSPELSKDASFGDRFLREARIVSRLIHPNIVTVYDVGIHDGYYFLSMEYVPGQELTDKRYDLTLTDSLAVIKDIARALDFAGKKGYVHRDVKPENIMLHEEGGRAVLMDFGIARPSDVASGMTQTGMAIGTPHYMSPEQAKGVPVDARADLYSLGVVLFLLLTGRVPFHADSAVVVGIMHVSEDIPRLPPYAQVFQSIIDRILAKDPADRYQTGAEFVRDLEAFSPKEIADAAENRELAMALVKAEEIAAAESKANITATSGVDENDTSFSSSENEKTMLAGRYAEPNVRSAEFSAQRADESPNDTTLEAMAAVAEDRVGPRHEPDDEQQSSKLGVWLVVGVFVLVGCGIYFQAALRERLSEYIPMLQADTTQSLAAESDLSVSSAHSDAVNLAPVDAVDGVVNDVESTTFSVFAAQAVNLQAEIATDLSKAVELVALYRAGLESTDTLQQDAAKQGLLDLQTFYSTSIQQALDAGDTEQVQSYVESVQSLFTEAEYSVSLQDVLAKKRGDDALTLQLQQAQTYITENALSSPVGANALEIYQALLVEDPDLVVAQQGIVNIAQRYGELAAEQQKKGNIDQALGLIAQGLVLNTDNTQLLEQQQVLTQLQAEQKKQRAAENILLEKAKKQQEAGQLIAPRGDSAVETYRELLAKNAQHRAARNAVEVIEKSLLQEIKQLIQTEDFTAASARLASARESFPQSRALLSLNLDLDQAIHEHMPSVAKLAVTSQESDSLSAQEPTIAADRNIYIGFEYRNFKAETSVIQAILYEGSRSHQIVQVPVIISGKQGVQFFRMEQPVTGFAEGGYSIDLLLNNQLLITAKFSVKKSL